MHFRDETRHNIIGTEEFNNSRYHNVDDILKQPNTDQTCHAATDNQPSVNTTLLNESTKLHSLRHTCPWLERHRLVTTVSFFVANDEQERWIQLLIIRASYILSCSLLCELLTSSQETRQHLSPSADREVG